MRLIDVEKLHSTTINGSFPISHIYVTVEVSLYGRIGDKPLSSEP